MADEIVPPFSARNRGAYAQIDNECPETTRVGLLHLIRQLVDLEYVAGWKFVTEELQRIGRIKPTFGAAHFQDTEDILLQLEWDKVFDFCERLHGHLVREVSYFDSDAQAHVVTTTRSDAQKYIVGELQRLFLEENLAFQFGRPCPAERPSPHSKPSCSR